MKRLLLLLLLVAGCRTWDVRAFGVPLDGKERYMTASSELTSEEKIGVIVILAVAIAVPVALAVSD
jgi:hypothetical protein